MQALVASLPVHNTNNRNSPYSSGASQGFGKFSAAPVCLHLGRPWQPAFGQQVRKKTAFDIQRRVSGHRQDWVCALQALERVEANRESWLLEPIGDGTTEHLINKAVSLPSAFHLGIDTATVGRLAGRADIVIPIATVSGVHARLEKKDGNLFVTDLNSTNGTYVDNKRIKPQTVTPVSPGSRITFDDSQLFIVHGTVFPLVAPEWSQQLLVRQFRKPPSVGLLRDWVDRDFETLYWVHTPVRTLVLKTSSQSGKSRFLYNFWNSTPVGNNFLPQEGISALRFKAYSVWSVEVSGTHDLPDGDQHLATFRFSKSELGHA